MEVAEILIPFGYSIEDPDYGAYELRFKQELSDVYVSHNQDKLVFRVTIDFAPEVSFNEVLAISTLMVAIEPRLSDTKWIWEGLVRVKDTPLDSSSVSSFVTSLFEDEIVRRYDDLRVRVYWVGTDISIDLIAIDK